MFTHQFTDEVLFARYAHFVGRIQLDREHTLDCRLADRCNLRALNVFTQQHTEHGRHGGIFTRGIDEVYARRACRNGEQQTARAALTTACLQHDLIAVGLVDFLHAAACQHVIEFICHCPEADRI